MHTHTSKGDTTGNPTPGSVSRSNENTVRIIGISSQSPVSGCHGLTYLLAKTIHPLAVNPSKIAFMAKTTVARCFGFLYTASRYTFSPPLRGNMVPYSSQMKRPQNDMMNPSTHSISDAPTDPTDPKIDEGVEKTAVPMIRPTLYIEEWKPARDRANCDRTHIKSVQLKMPRWRPIPPAASGHTE